MSWNKDVTCPEKTGQLLRKAAAAATQEDAPTYYVDYAFNDPATSRELTAETQVWKSHDWEQAVTGQKVIVLYASDKPKRSTAFEFGGYQSDLENETRPWDLAHRVALCTSAEADWRRKSTSGPRI